MDMLRKLSLVGFVVLVGRGSVAQIAFGNMLSFAFFAAHMYYFPMKTKWDNWLRAAAEIHVFWTILNHIKTLVDTERFSTIEQLIKVFNYKKGDKSG